MRSGAPRARRSGLVIGAGATVGGAWAAGVLCALAETEGFEATACEVVVGTSAGSVVAALLAAGVPPQEMADSFPTATATASPSARL
jgi:NTE family protein